jgi:metal-dependent amidase/aminoacylase/carboxypeptidase family protein
MIKEGCLDGVDEVYGCHQWPTAPLGEIWCKYGPVMSEITIVKIKVIGTSGHGS